jgi:rubrerythrin
MSFRDGLERDLAGENKAIRDYQTRIHQSTDKSITATLEEIEGDEQNHKRRLKKVLSGLRSATE